MVTRVTVTLEQPEYTALLEVAGKELRNPADQVRFVLRQELERQGMLPATGKAKQPLPCTMPTPNTESQDKG
jgi:hypothetical protein